MADINHAHAAPPGTEGDGINYRGLFWFLAILALTTLVSQGLMWGLFRYFDADADAHDAMRAPTAAALGAEAPMPALLTNEPLNLETFRTREDEMLSSYGWVDQNAGIVRLPIDRAKALVLERGLPGGSLPFNAPAPGTTTDAVQAAAAAAAKPVKVIKK